MFPGLVILNETTRVKMEYEYKQLPVQRRVLWLIKMIIAFLFSWFTQTTKYLYNDNFQIHSSYAIASFPGPARLSLAAQNSAQILYCK